MNNTRGTIQSATSDAGSAPRKHREVMTLQGKAKLLAMYHRLKSAAAVAHHLKIKWIQGKDHYYKNKKKGNHKVIAAAMPARAKTLHFLQNTFLSCFKNIAFMWEQDCYKEGMPIDTNMIQEKGKSSYDN